MVFHLYPQLSQYVSAPQFQLLLVLLTRLRPVIERELSRRENSEQLLPSTVSEFLAHALDIDRDIVASCWNVLRPHRDSLGQDVDYHTLADDLFRLLGPKYGLGS